MALLPALKKEEVEEEAEKVYEKFEEETGEVPQWVRVMAHDSKITKEFTELFKVIMKEGELEPLLRWEIAYTVSQSLKCPFCVDVTGKMLKSLGASEGIVEQVKSKDLPEKEQKVLKLVEQVTEKARCEAELFEQLKDEFTEEELIEIVSIIGLFNYINRFNNTLCIVPE